MLLTVRHFYLIFQTSPRGQRRAGNSRSRIHREAPLQVSPFPGGTGGLGLYGVEQHYLGADLPDVVRGTEDLSGIETDQDDPPELFPNGSDESSFHFRLDTGAIPGVSIFRKNNVQRSMSHAFHERMVAQETDPLKKPAAANSKDGVLAYLEGLTFHATGAQKDQIEVTIHGNQTEAKLPRDVSRGPGSGKSHSNFRPKPIVWMALATPRLRARSPSVTCRRNASCS